VNSWIRSVRKSRVRFPRSRVSFGLFLTSSALRNRAIQARSVSARTRPWPIVPAGIPSGFPGAAIDHQLLLEVPGLAVGLDEVPQRGSAGLDGLGQHPLTESTSPCATALTRRRRTRPWPTRPMGRVTSGSAPASTPAPSPCVTAPTRPSDDQPTLPSPCRRTFHPVLTEAGAGACLRGDQHSGWIPTLVPGDYTARCRCYRDHPGATRSGAYRPLPHTGPPRSRLGHTLRRDVQAPEAANACPGQLRRKSR
jgi:hypothetical protein